MRINNILMRIKNIKLDKNYKHIIFFYLILFLFISMNYNLSLKIV